MGAMEEATRSGELGRRGPGGLPGSPDYVACAHDAALTWVEDAPKGGRAEPSLSAALIKLPYGGALDWRFFRLAPDV